MQKGRDGLRRHGLFLFSSCLMKSFIPYLPMT